MKKATKASHQREEEEAEEEEMITEANVIEEIAIEMMTNIEKGRKEEEVESITNKIQQAKGNLNPTTTTTK